MAVKYGKFELPEHIKIDEKTKTDSFARFIAEPLERGFAHTFGTSFRRILLSSLEAPSIVSVRIEGVPHEYMAVDGVIEDMTHIILNFKESYLRYMELDEEKQSKEYKLISKILEVTEEMIKEGGGQYKVTFKDVMGYSEFEIVNPDQHIMTITKPMTKRFDIRVGIGRGYVPSERHQGFERNIDEIVIDSAYSPVRVVNYFVENTRVGQDTDFDRLILEVKTDGRITPQEALTFACQIGVLHFKAFDQVTIPIICEEEKTEENKDKEDILRKLAQKINEIELSVRSTNCLINANIKTIGELVLMPESDMLKFRNFGKKSLTEIKQKLENMGLRLGMEYDLKKYGINRENVKNLIETYLEDKLGTVEQ